VLEALGGAQWFSSLDLASGYRQMQVKEEDRPETAFLANKGLKLIPTKCHFLQMEVTFFSLME